MKTARIIISTAFLICFVFIITGCSFYTVVKHSENNKGGESKFYFDDNSFDSDKFVSSSWNDKIIPGIEKKAADIAQVVKELKSNADDAGKKYGIRSSESGAAWNFAVKGKVKVLKVNTESRNGTLDVDLEPYDNTKDLSIQIGPVFRGTSLRDSLDFIKFDDFKNQLVFASISSSLNNYVRDNITNNFDTSNIAGQEISFLGTFTFDSQNNIASIPVKLEKAGGQK